MKIKGIIVVFFVLLAIWLILNGTADMPVVLIGAGLSLFLSLVLCSKCSVFNEIRISFRALVYTFMYLGVFISELVKSNFDVARRVLSPALPINPGIVKAETRLKSRMGRMILANSITLTPGTFTIDVIGDTFYIHCVHIEGDDTEKYAQSIVRKFEKYLEVLYG
ncbi:MAG: Na+/H+ antiporter subunit E [Bacteroidales bacterium]|nr:Na+/H+ antiporter subunit E [Bacteroidales bacterium]